jgi:ribosomal protein S1
MFVTINEKTTEVALGDIKEGSIFTGRISNYSDRLFFKTEDRIYSLDPEGIFSWWSNEKCVVENYQNVTSITVTV